MTGGRPARSTGSGQTPELAPPALELLAASGGAWQARSDPIAAERAITAALAGNPYDLDLRLAAYRFHFYNHRLAEALQHADVIISIAARRLNISTDWTAVEPADATFGDAEAAPGIFLQALLARGYCAVRVGLFDEGRRAIAKVIALDPRDRFGARRLLAVIDEGLEAEEGQ